MKKSVLASLGAIILTFAVEANAQQVVGTNSIVRNDVQTKSVGATEFRPAVRKANARLNDRIVTRQASMLQVRLLDKTNFTVGPNSQVTLDRFVYDPAKGASEVGASVARGAFRFMSGKATHKRPGKSTIKTPVATIGIRGTIVDVVVGPDAIVLAEGENLLEVLEADPETASMIVLRGPPASGNEPAGAIDVTAAGKTVSADRPRLALFIPNEDSPPGEPFEISTSGLLTLERKMEPMPTEVDVDPASIDDDEKALRIIAHHNRERAKVGAAPLAWDPDLADQAVAHALTVARTGIVRHSNREGRDALENLIWTPIGLRSFDNMLEMWSREVENFVPGAFPNVSKTGRWQDVGHYTQIIWPTTQWVGCSHQRAEGRDVILCLYPKGGNVDDVLLP